MRTRAVVVAATLAAATIGWSTTRVAAHVTVVSPFTFYRDVQPILERRCDACHGDGGVAPTALRQYSEVRSQSWPLRQVLISGRMPPWFAESGRAGVKAPQALTARELDVLLTWAAGGAPEGNPADRRDRQAPREPPTPPDVVIPMPEPFTLGANGSVADVDVGLPSAALDGKWIRAVNLLPGTPSIVRRAQIAIKTAGGEQVIGLWIPGDVPQLLEGGAAFHVPPEASVRLRIHYQKPRASSAPVADRSRVAVYLADPMTAQPVEAIDITADARPIDRRVRAVAIRPVGGPADAHVQFTVIAANGSRASLLALQLRPEWPRRYVFVAPLTIERGSRIEATIALPRPLLWRSLTGDRPAPIGDDQEFHATLEIIR
jgi:hypothetical protein